jgi:hypothetical protein
MFLAGSEQGLTFVCGCFVYSLTYQVLISQEACHAGTDENQGVGLFILNFSARWEWVVSAVLRPIYSQERTRHMFCGRGCVVPRASVYGCGENKNLLFLPELGPRTV